MIRPGGQTHYHVLGLAPTATVAQIEKAYRFSLELYGEGALGTYSLIGPGEAQQERRRIHDAYQILKDPELRRDYDLSIGVEPKAAVEVVPRPPAAVSLPLPFVVEEKQPPAPMPIRIPVTTGPRKPAEPAPSASPPAPPRAAQLLPDPVTGAALRRFRESKGIHLRDVATATKIGVRFLEYLEADRPADLPAPIYVRSFLQEYARAVGLEPRATADAYMARFPSSG